VTPLRAFLLRHRRIGLDTSVFIYYLEANPSYVDLSAEIFAWLETAKNTGVTSTLTMTELLVHPYRQGDEAMVNQYYSLLSLFPNLEWTAPDLPIADVAARLRAQHRLRTPDALQVATAIRAGASAFLTNDSSLARVDEVEIGILDQLR
jgi:predicted nucleic acid-binding protein